MMWYPDKAAFRVGRVTNDNWDTDSIGDYSMLGEILQGIRGFSIHRLGISTKPQEAPLGEKY